MAARFPLGWLLDTQGRRRVLAGAGVLHVAVWLGFLTIGGLGIRSAALVVMYGLVSGSLFASYFTYASDIVPVTRRSEGIAMFGIWGMLPNGLGPLLGDFLIEHAGFQHDVDARFHLSIPSRSKYPASFDSRPIGPRLRMRESLFGPKHNCPSS